MYIRDEQVPLLAGLGLNTADPSDVLPPVQDIEVDQAVTLPSGTLVAFEPGSVFLVEDLSKVNYPQVKNCRPSARLRFTTGGLLIQLAKPLAVGYREDGRMVIASNSTDGAYTAGRGLLQGTMPSGFDLVCNVLGVVTGQAKVAVEPGGLIGAVTMPAGVSAPPLIRSAPDTEDPPAPPELGECPEGQVYNAEGTCVPFISPVAPEPCPEGQWRAADGTCVPLVGVVPAPPATAAKPWYKRPVTYVVAGGLTVLGGVAIAASRRRAKR